MSVCSQYDQIIICSVLCFCFGLYVRQVEAKVCFLYFKYDQYSFKMLTAKNFNFRLTLILIIIL